VIVGHVRLGRKRAVGLLAARQPSPPRDVRADHAQPTARWRSSAVDRRPSLPQVAVPVEARYGNTDHAALRLITWAGRSRAATIATTSSSGPHSSVRRPRARGSWSSVVRRNARQNVSAETASGVRVVVPAGENVSAETAAGVAAGPEHWTQRRTSETGEAASIATAVACSPVVVSMAQRSNRPAGGVTPAPVGQFRRRLPQALGWGLGSTAIVRLLA
jgi:hypothetical protein